MIYKYLVSYRFIPPIYTPYAGTGFDYGRDYFFAELFTKDYGKFDMFKGFTKSYDTGYPRNFTKSNIEASIAKLLKTGSLGLRLFL